VHVLHVIEATVGGTRRHAVDVCRGLARRGVRTTLIASAERDPAFRGDLQALARERVEVRELPMVRAIRPATDARHAFELRRALREQRPDIVHTHSSKAGVLGRGASIATGIGARVHTPHTFAFLFGAMFGSASRALFRTVERALAARTHRFVAVSEDEARTFERSGIVPPATIRVVANGVEVEPWRSAAPIDRRELGVPPDAPCAAVVGLLNVAKGQDLALRALAQPGLETLHLLVVGTGELEQSYAELARELGVSERAHLLGWRDDVPRVLAACDALVLPSRWEGMPYIVLEAMAAGLPVVAARVDGARGVIESAQCGVLCDVGSVEALADALRKLFALDQGARAAMGERGRKIVARCYSVDAMLDGLLTVYRELA
jgi:glycosyltransferase involved in cell wall biosynthesis